MSASDPVLTVKQLAAIEGLSRDWIYKAIRRGGLPTVKVGGYRIRMSEFRAWWNEQRLARATTAG
jgi:excisionase family DNA binding protein